jgi:hypothetical protein
MKWKGYDWTEIAEFLGVDILQDNEETIAKETHQLLHQLFADARQADVTEGAYPGSSKQKIKEIRQFVSKLIEQNQGYDKPLWEGLLAIEDDSVFIEYVDRLLECMWT